MSFSIHLETLFVIATSYAGLAESIYALAIRLYTFAIGFAGFVASSHWIYDPVKFKRIGIS